MTSVKKKTCVLFLVQSFLFLMFCPTQAVPFQNQPDGFHGIQWGTPASDIPGLQPVRRTGSDVFCVMKNENLEFGSARLKIIVYIFSQNRFYAASLGFEGEKNFEKIRSLLFYQHGKRANEAHDGYEYEWIGKDVILSLKYNPRENFGYVDYIYRPMMIKQKHEKALK
ncbi:MAG: hypothetical protein PHO00_03595 [bacterium]|nr:hypothetical protein [bacterium]